MKRLAAICTAVAVMAATLSIQTTEARAATQTIDVGSETSTYSSNVRGYWFTAPVDFWITGIDVPTDASTSPFDAAILRLPSAPPEYGTTTVTYDILYEVFDQATAVSGLSIGVSAGDVIGVLGYRGNVNSYNGSRSDADIFGFATPLTRFGTQYTLDGGISGKPVWQESTSSNIGRVFLEISSTPAAVPVPSSLALALGGLGAIVVLRRRKNPAI